MASAKTSFFKSEVFRNKYVWFALTSCTLIIMLVLFVEPFAKALHVQPLRLEDWLVVFVASTASLLIIQLLKRTKIICDEE